MRHPPFNPTIGVIIGVIAISFTSVLVKLMSGAPATIIANYRLLFAFIALFPVVFIKYRKEFPFMNSHEWLLAILAGLFTAGFFTFWFESLQYTAVGSSVVIKTLQPILVFLIMHLFVKERFSPGVIISICIVLLGGFILFTGDFEGDKNAFFGDILALISTVFLAISYILGQKLRKRLSHFSYTFIISGVGATILLIYNIGSSTSFIHYPLYYWILFIIIALVPTFLGHALFRWALKWIRASTVAIASVFESAIAAFLAYIFLKEQISSSLLLGGTIIGFGLFLFTVSTTQKRKVTISESNE